MSFKEALGREMARLMAHVVEEVKHDVRMDLNELFEGTAYGPFVPGGGKTFDGIRGIVDEDI